jgi:predicted nucleotide-binding protein
VWSDAVSRINQSKAIMRVLVVDDDYAFARAIASRLQNDGFHVSTACSAEDAMEYAEKADPPFDVVLLDICLPAHHRSESIQVEGFNVAIRLRDAFPNIRLVAYSALMSPDVIKKLSGTFDDVVHKTSADDLLDLIRDIADPDIKKPRPTIFIVHGHDDGTKLHLKNYLQNTLKLGQPVVLHEQPSLGRTIIEKFEDIAQHVDVVFVVLTPDDLSGQPSDKNVTKRRARQNVIFEMGFFVGKLNRRSGRVVLLHKGDTELPSDISGLVYIDITNGIDAASEEIRRELHEWLI